MRTHCPSLHSNSALIYTHKHRVRLPGVQLHVHESAKHHGYWFLHTVDASSLQVDLAHNTEHAILCL